MRVYNGTAWVAAYLPSASYVDVSTNQTVGGVKTFSSNPILSGGTANGVAYLNGSKVLTTGSALTFDGTTLTNTRNTTDGSAATLTLNNSGATASYATLNLNAGSVNYQQFADAAGNAIGAAGVMFRTTTNHPLVWGVNNSEQMRLTSTGLGIGTSSPAYKLDVQLAGYPTVQVASTLGSGANGSIFQSKNGGGATSYFGTETTSGGYSYTGGIANATYIGSAGANPLQFITNAAARATLDTSGNLGLGVTPSAWNSSQWSVFEGAYGGALAFYKASNVPVTVLTSNAYNDGSWKYKTTDPALQYEMDGNVGIHKWYTAPSGTAGNTISFTQALTLHASGGLSLGNTTDPGATNLSVTGTITSGKGADVASASTVTLGAGNFFDITGTTTISNITIKPAGTVVYLKFDGSLTLQTGSIGSSGAMRLTNGASLGVSQYDVLTLISDGTNWWQVAYNNN
jgi:hypothetical protein